jgi:hypothetical protein
MTYSQLKMAYKEGFETFWKSHWLNPYPMWPVASPQGKMWERGLTAARKKYIYCKTYCQACA